MPPCGHNPDNGETPSVVAALTKVRANRFFDRRRNAHLERLARDLTCPPIRFEERHTVGALPEMPPEPHLLVFREVPFDVVEAKIDELLAVDHDCLVPSTRPSLSMAPPRLGYGIISGDGYRERTKYAACRYLGVPNSVLAHVDVARGPSLPYLRARAPKPPANVGASVAHPNHFEAVLTRRFRLLTETRPSAEETDPRGPTGSGLAASPLAPLEPEQPPVSPRGNGGLEGLRVLHGLGPTLGHARIVLGVAGQATAEIRLSVVSTSPMLIDARLLTLSPHPGQMLWAAMGVARERLRFRGIILMTSPRTPAGGGPPTILRAGRRS